MSIERYLLTNGLLDGLLLGIAARSIGLIHPGRLALATLLASLYGFAPGIMLGSATAQLLFLMALSLLIVGRWDARLALTASLTLAAGSAVTAGGALLLGHIGRIPGLATGLLLWSALMLIRPPARRIWEITVCMRVNGRLARFPALIDTGNRLREPLSHQPVLLVEAHALRKVLPENGYRNVAYGGVGASGRLPCFRPGELWVERGRRRTPVQEIWVGVVPGRLPGGTHALAPCEFALMRF